MDRQFDDLIRKQNDLSQHLMDSFSKAFKKSSQGRTPNRLGVDGGSPERVKLS